MIRNYLKIAYRNIVKSKLFSAINIAGMAIGMASFMLISTFVWDELKYDTHYADKDRTFRIYNIRKGTDGTTNYYPIVPPVFATKLEENFGEVESTMRVLDTYGEVMFDIDGDRFFERNVIYAEPAFFDILDVELLKGDPATALEKGRHIIVSESFAQAHLGNEPLGKVIKLDQGDFTVSGVFEDFPEHSHLDLEVVISMESLYHPSFDMERMKNWVWQQFFTYVKLKEEVDPQAFEEKFASFIEEEAWPVTEPRGFTYRPYLQNVQDIYLRSSKLEMDIAKKGSIYTVTALSASAIFIIIIVCINFINLSTARSLNRVKEVGVRKVIGAVRKQLVFQFLGESILLAVVSVLIAGLMAELLLPYLNAYADKSIQFHFVTEPLVLLSIIAFAVFIGCLAGVYPALYASKFKPVAILGKGSASKLSSTSVFRKVMVVIQFTLSIFLIVGSIVVYQQLSFLRNKDLGFNKEQIIFFRIRDNIRDNLDAAKQEFLNHPAIMAATYSYGLPGDLVSGDEVVDAVSGKEYPANHFMVDHDYIQTMQLELLAGRTFSKDHSTDHQSAFIINETAMKNLGYNSPEEVLGKELKWDMWHYDSVKTARVIGVVKDFHFKSLREDMSSTVLQIYPEAYHTLALRIKPENISETLTFIENKWAELEPEWPFAYTFMDDAFDKMYKSEERLNALFTIFTGLGIFIACIGLFGLVYYTTTQKVREIGIRKVLGAGIKDILMLVNKGFLALIAIALVIAVPFSYYLADYWLQNFSYKIEVSPLIFVIAGLAMVMITLITVSYQSLRAARTNPVEVLKEE